MALTWRPYSDDLAVDGAPLSGILGAAQAENASVLTDLHGRSCGHWIDIQQLDRRGMPIAAPTRALGAALTPVLVPRPLRSQRIAVRMRVSADDATTDDPVSIVPAVYVEGSIIYAPDVVTMTGTGEVTVEVEAYVSGRRAGGGPWVLCGIGWSSVVDAEDAVEIEPTQGAPMRVTADADASTLTADAYDVPCEVTLPAGDVHYVGASEDSGSDTIGYCWPPLAQSATYATPVVALPLPIVHLHAYTVALIGSGVGTLPVPAARSGQIATAASAQDVRTALTTAFTETSPWLRCGLDSSLAFVAQGVASDGAEMALCDTWWPATERATELSYAVAWLGYEACDVTTELEVTGETDGSAVLVLATQSWRSHPLLFLLNKGLGAWRMNSACIVGPERDDMRAYQVQTATLDVAGVATDDYVVEATASAVPLGGAPSGASPRLLALACAASIMEVRR